MTGIVVVMGSVPSPAGMSGLSGEVSGLQQLLNSGDQVDVTVVSLGLGWDIAGLKQCVDLGSQRRPFVDRAFAVLGFYALRDRLSRFPIGRLLNSMGPVDQGRVFWRLVKRDPQAIAALKRADIAVAADLAAVKTSWVALRRGWVSGAQYDHRAAGLGLVFPIPTAAPDQS